MAEPTTKSYAHGDDLPATARLRVCDLGADQRPRERVLQHGASVLSDAELLAILLGGGTPEMSVIDLAGHILRSTDNSLVGLARMPVKEMMRRFKGVGPAKAVTIAATIEFGSRLHAALEIEQQRRVRITDSASVYNFIRRRVELLNHEEFWVIGVSGANTVKATWCVSSGGMQSTVVDARMVFGQALTEGVAAIILVHNHPSGTLSPSREDESLTKRLKTAGDALQIRIIDHLIIGQGGYYSFADNGLL